MTTPDNRPAPDPAVARAAMVTALRDDGLITSSPVAAAMSTVPREAFAPGEPLGRVYATDATLAPKVGPDGRPTSVVSASHIQAIQLEQAAVEPGMRVLEVGSGGYNAALLAELVGPTGSVTTVDIDPDVVARARAGLRHAGYEHAVDVVCADAEHGVPDGAPYDRIVVTVGAWDLPPAWLAQLAPGGRIVVPLRFAAITRLLALDHVPGTPELTAVDYRLGAFVPMQGDGAATEQTITITEDIALRTDPRHATTYDIPALRAALDAPPVRRWTGTPFDMPDELQLFLLTSDTDVPMLHAAQRAIDHGIVDRAVRLGVPAIVRGGSLAYRVKRENDTMPSGYETGVIAHGPDADQIADHLADLIRRWATDHYRRGTAHITYRPNPANGADPHDAADTADAPGSPHGPGPELDGWHAVKRHGVLTVRWP